MSGTIGSLIGAYRSLGGFTTAFGWSSLAIGASHLFGGKQIIEGARLNDLSVQTSDPGVPIPVFYGTERLAGNIIWSTRIIEGSYTEEVGGKGGNQPEQ